MKHSVGDLLEERYGLFLELFFQEFLKTSAVVWKQFKRREGDKWVSYDDDVQSDPVAFIENWSEGKIDELKEELLDKLDSALIVWALEKMKEDEFASRVEKALALFWRQILFSPKPESADLLERVKTARLIIPTKSTRKPDFPYHKLEEIRVTYEQALDTAKRIKRESGRDPTARRHEIEKEWSSLPAVIRTKYESMSPTEIARDFTTRKHAINLGSISLKKALHENKKDRPQDIIGQYLRRTRID